ncbi:MAG: alpha/beta hydrolase-fold protein [Pseudomonadales bacterium]|nr:alpha/beta hydrolase-fold protein [Pseudomonadales bacterium]|tara:strand:- start:986 stop:1987 length:1002 start_codon:yes stop_codon:yes gene_type:complete
MDKKINDIFLKLFLSALMMLVMSCGGGSGTIEEEKPTEGIPDETPSDGSAPECSNYSELENTQFCTLSIGGLMREFYLHLPENYSDQVPPLPVLISLHGGGDYADANMAYSGFRQLADQNSFVTIYPQGAIYEEKNSTGWNTEFEGVDDITFLESVIDWTIENFNVQPKEFYAAGFSNGAFMAYHMACNLSHKIAAVAPVAGLMGITTYETCNPIHSMSIIHLHGELDNVIYIDGGDEYLPLEDNGTTSGVVTYWKNFNECNVFEEEILQSEGNLIGSVGVWKDCRDGMEINYWKLSQVGHEWESKGEGEDVINVPTTIWNFVSQFNIDGPKD